MRRIHGVNRTPSLASLDLNLLVVFDAVLKERSITLAAQRVGLSQPAVSSALNRLRRSLGDPLFVRTGRGMQPTPYAQLLAPPIQRACDLIGSSLEIGAAFDPPVASHTFAFYMTDVGEAIFLPRLLGALKERAPRLKVKVHGIPARGEQDAMAAGAVDIAVGLFPDLKAGFFQQRLYCDDFVCLVRAQHPRARGPLSVKQFSDLPHAVIASAGTGHEALLERAFAEHRLRRRAALTIPHFMAAPVVIAQTDYVAMVPRRLAQAFAGFPGIRMLDPPIRTPAIEIRQHWHERYHHDPANKWMRALIAELFLE